MKHRPQFLPRKALGWLLDAIGEQSARFAGWVFCRASAVNPEPPEPASRESVERILAAIEVSSDYTPDPFERHAAYLAEARGVQVHFVPRHHTSINLPMCAVENPGARPSPRAS